MRFPWQDKSPHDGKPDDYPFDTWMEIWVATIGITLIGILFFVILGYLSGA